MSTEDTKIGTMKNIEAWSKCGLASVVIPKAMKMRTLTTQTKGSSEEVRRKKSSSLNFPLRLS